MFNYGHKEKIIDEIQTYFNKNVGSKTIDTTELAYSYKLYSYESLEKCINILKAYAVPFDTIDINGECITESGAIHNVKYRVNYILYNTSDQPVRVQTVNGKIAEALKPFGWYSHSHGGIQLQDKGFITPRLLNQMKETRLYETNHRYLCFSVDDYTLFKQISDENKLPSIAFNKPSETSYWGYLSCSETFCSHVYKELGINDDFVEDNICSPVSSRDYEQILDYLNIPYIVISDYHNELKIIDRIFPQKSKHNYRNDLGIVLRSSWEANIARILNYLNVEWEYEKQHFELPDNVLYLPDFFLPNNTILEIKGFWDSSSRIKVNAFKKAHPETVLLLVDSDMYPTLEKIYKDKINRWEDSLDNYRVSSDIISIVGMKFCASASILNDLTIGDKVFFIREPDNTYDPNAILALASNRSPIGHVSSDWTFILSSKMDLGMEYTGIITEISQKVIKASIKRSNPNAKIVHSILLD